MTIDGLRWTENQTPCVSVVVPNYNHARFLEQRLDSIFQQTFQDFEVILLDDASTDDSLNILQKYKQQYTQVNHLLVSEQNSGSPFAQWKKGIQLAKGKYIWIAESDDWADKTFLEKLLPLVSKENVGLVFCNSYWTDEKGKIGESLSIHNVSFLKEGKIEIAEHLVYHNSIQNVSSVLFNREKLIECSDNFTNYRIAGDWLLYIELLLKSKVAFCDEKLNYFRWYPSNVSNRTQKRGLWTKEGIEILSLIGDKVKLRGRKLWFVFKKWIIRILSFVKKTGDVKSMTKMFGILFSFLWNQSIKRKI